MIRIAVCQSETVVSLTVPVAVTVGMTVPVEQPDTADRGLRTFGSSLELVREVLTQEAGL
jgi:hypothetical protein